MNKQLTFSLGTLLFLGIILVPTSICYFKEAMPFMIAASCIGAILSYLFFSEKAKYSEAQNAVMSELSSSLNAIAKQMTGVQDSISNSQKSVEAIKDATSNSINEMAEVLKNVIADQTKELQKSNEELKSELKDFETKCLEALSTTISNIVSQQANCIDLLNTMHSLSKDKLTEMSKYIQTTSDTSKAIAASLSQVSAQQSSLITELKEAVESGNASIATSLDRITTTIDKNNTFSQENLKGIKDAVNDSMKYLEDTRTQTIESSNKLSSSLSSFLGNNEYFQTSMSQTIARIVTLQHNLEETTSKQSDTIDNVLNKFTDNLSSIFNRIKKELTSATDSVTESLSESNKKLEDNLQEVIDNIETYTQDISGYMEDLKNNIKLHDDKLSKLSKYIPTLQELNSSEEQMMRELEKICRTKR